MSSSFVIGIHAHEKRMTENTLNNGVEELQPSVTLIMSHDHQTQLFRRPITSSEASKHLSTIQKPSEPAKVKTYSEAGASSMTSMTEKTSQAEVDPSNPWMNAASFKEATDVEMSPMTETDQSEPKTGTTTASYRTGASSPSFSIQDQIAFYSQQRASFGNEEDRPSITHAQSILAYSFLDFVYLTEEMKDVDELVIADTQDPHEDRINVGRNQRSTLMWAAGVETSCLGECPQTSHDPHNPATETALTASAPGRPKTPRDVETERLCEDTLPKEPLAKATWTPVYNPLAAEWCPSSPQNILGKLIRNISWFTLTPSKGLLKQGRLTLSGLI